jgi:hypothetical protein
MSKLQLLKESTMGRRLAVLFCPVLLAVSASAARGADYADRDSRAVSAKTVELSAEELADKIRGGFVGQLLGNLNGLPHENRYYEEPGNVEQCTPAMADGARTDDDTDIEWVYIVAMQRSGRIMLEPEQITELWKTHINQHIWCSNLYVRQPGISS